MWKSFSFADIASTSSSQYGFHKKCYSRFCNKKNIANRSTKQALVKRKLEEKEEASVNSEAPSAKILRSAALFKATEKSRPPHLLPLLCIICGKKERNLKKSLQKRLGRKKDVLCVALTKDAGKCLIVLL